MVSEGNKPGFFRRAHMTLFPRHAINGMKARALAEYRGYAAAKAHRKNRDGWSESNASQDAEIRADAQTLRKIMRGLVRDNPLVANAIHIIAETAIGDGIRPQANTGRDELDRRIDQAWHDWAEGTEGRAVCDRHQHTNFYGLQHLAVRLMVEGGDAFAMLRPIDRRRRIFRDLPRGTPPFQVELREADMLVESNSLNNTGGKLREGHYLVNGIEYTATGDRVAYWMWREHPGNGTTRSFEAAQINDLRRIPVEDVAHMFELLRDQSRGVAWGTASMRDVEALGDWNTAEVLRKRLSAAIFGMQNRPEGAEAGITGEVQDADGNLVETLAPGTILYGDHGSEFKLHTPQTDTGAKDFQISQTHLVANGFRLPYMILAGDLRQTNFASGRIGLHSFYQTIRGLRRRIVIPMLCQPIWSWFLDYSRLSGVIPADFSDPIRVKWVSPAWGYSVNPQQEAEAQKTLIRTGLKTQRQAIAENGRDPDEVFAEIAETNELLDREGIILDSDPRVSNKSGSLQGDAAGDEGDGGNGGAAPDEEDDE